MKSLIEQLAMYNSYHQSRANKLTHFIGVPLIIFSLLIPLHWIYMDWVLLFILIIYYASVDKSIASVFAMVLLVIMLPAHKIATTSYNKNAFIIFILFFITGWVIQFIGHIFEGRKPAFLDNFMQLFVAPMFLVMELFFLLNYKVELKHQVDVNRIYFSK